MKNEFNELKIVVEMFGEENCKLPFISPMTFQAIKPKFYTRKTKPIKAYHNTKTNQLVIEYDDGTKSSSTCHKEDHFNPYIGFALAYCAKKFGSKTKFMKYVDSLYKSKKAEVK